MKQITLTEAYDLVGRQSEARRASEAIERCKDVLEFLGITKRGAMPQRKESIMWQKILLRILVVGVNAVPWERIAELILNLLAKRIRESEATLETLDPKEFLAMIEQVMADKLKVKFDLNRDGEIGTADITNDGNQD